MVWFKELCLYHTADALRLLVSTGFVSLCLISFRFVSLISLCLFTFNIVTISSIYFLSLLISAYSINSSPLFKIISFSLIIFCLLLQSNFPPLFHQSNLVSFFSSTDFQSLLLSPHPISSILLLLNSSHPITYLFFSFSLLFIWPVHVLVSFNLHIIIFSLFFSYCFIKTYIY